MDLDPVLLARLAVVVTLYYLCTDALTAPCLCGCVYLWLSLYHSGFLLRLKWLPWRQISHCVQLRFPTSFMKQIVRARAAARKKCVASSGKGPERLNIVVFKWKNVSASPPLITDYLKMNWLLIRFRPLTVTLDGLVSG